MVGTVFSGHAVCHCGSPQSTMNFEPSLAIRKSSPDGPQAMVFHVPLHQPPRICAVDREKFDRYEAILNAGSFALVAKLLKR